MKVTRRDFIRVSSVAVAGMPLLQTGCWPGVLRNEVPLSAEALYERFRRPPSSARLFVRWWWNGNRLDKKELLRELDVMKAAGIGGVEINPIKFPEQADPHGYEALDWLSDPWMDMLKTALSGARERGIACDMIVGSGWPFGGEFLGRKEQTQMMALGTRRLTGPRRYEVSRQELVDEVEPYIHSAYGDKLKELAMLRLVPARMDEFTPGMDLDEETTKDLIVIDVPEGEHELYYLVRQTGYMAVINGAPGASGPVLNHYSKEAVQKYLTRLSTVLNERIGHPGDHFRAFFTDSLELEGANWCDDMAGQFQERRGYSLLPYLPFVLFKVGHMGNALDEAYGATLSEEVQAMIRRVRYDFECTRAELFRERFVDTFQAWCAENGVRSRVQAYGRGYRPVESSMLIDIPECETWLGPGVGGPMPENNYLEGRAYSMINKFVSSGARLAGKKLISCEEITNTGMVFNASLERIKIAGDQSNLSGVTHSILHGFNYSPADVPFPGWIRYGTFFNEQNTWWPYFRRWSDYKARLSALFQEAELFSDIAVMHPLMDMWKQFGSQRDPFPTKVYPAYSHNLWEAIHQNGNGCDYVSERIVREATFEKGEMVYGNRRYKALLLMEVESMEPETAAALQKLVKAGGKLVFIGKEPHFANGFADYEKKEASMAATVATLKEEYSGQVILASAPDGPILEWYRDLQQQAGILPYLEFDAPRQAVSQVHYRSGEADIFFVTNSSLEESHRSRAKFAINGKTPWLWDPETGERLVYPHEENELLLELGPAASLLLVFTKNPSGARYVPLRPQTADGLAISGPWELSLQPVVGEAATLTLEQLTDFREHPDLRSFAGTAVYRKTFDVRDPEAFSCLRLGKAYGISEVSLNGQPLGVRWYGIHLFDLRDALKAGSNLLEIKITTVLGNYMKSLKDNPVARAWTQHQPYYPAGLAGPVDLLGANHLPSASQK